MIESIKKSIHIEWGGWQRNEKILFERGSECLLQICPTPVWAQVTLIHKEQCFHCWNALSCTLKVIYSLLHRKRGFIEIKRSQWTFFPVFGWHKIRQRAHVPLTWSVQSSLKASFSIVRGLFRGSDRSMKSDSTTAFIRILHRLLCKSSISAHATFQEPAF